MNTFPLKTRFGLYAAGLATLGVVASMMAVRPLIYRIQLAEVDRELESDAGELFRDLENFSDAPNDFRKPVPERFIPLSLRRKVAELRGPEGQLLYSQNLRGGSFAAHPEGFTTVKMMGTPAGGGPKLVPRNTRIGTFVHGFRTLHLGMRLGTIEAMQKNLMHAMLWIAPATGLLVFAGGWLLGRRALRPVTDLTAAAERIDAANPGQRLPLPAARDEIFRLTEVLNRSFDRLQLACEAAARFSADASHQLKTPLAVLRAGLEECRVTGGLSEEQREMAETLLRQTRRLASLVEDLLLLAQADSGRLHLETGPVPLAATLAPLLDDLDAACTSQGLMFSLTMPEDLLVTGDARRIGVIFQNLAENAVKYCAPQGRVAVQARREDVYITVSVENTGTPIPEEKLALVFERFNRAGRGEDVQGHGLGLNIARELARAQGGDVILERSDDSGTCFVLRLPAAQDMVL